MAKLILGPRIFCDHLDRTEHAPGLVHWVNSTSANYYGLPIPIAGFSSIEKHPASVDSGTSVSSPTLISFQTVATTTGGALGSAAAYSDYYRKLLLAGGPAGTHQLRIYGGTKPTSPDTMTDLASYDANLLVNFAIPIYSTDASITGFRPITYKPTSTVPMYHASQPVFNGMSFILGACPTFTNSTNTSDAVATWFWYGNVYGGVTDLSDVPFVIGTVGSTAASDLVIPDTVIKPDTPYKSYGFKFEIPVVYTI